MTANSSQKVFKHPLSYLFILSASGRDNYAVRLSKLMRSQPVEGFAFVRLLQDSCSDASFLLSFSLFFSFFFPPSELGRRVGQSVAKLESF